MGRQNQCPGTCTCRNFGSASIYRPRRLLGEVKKIVEGFIELKPAADGASIFIHQAAKGIRLGQVEVKLGFHVPVVVLLAAKAKKRGLKFGTVHEANGYQFANAKDPDKNSVCISSRAFRLRAAIGA